MLRSSVIVVLLRRSIGVDRQVSEPAMTGVVHDPGTSANFRYTTSTDMTRERADEQLPDRKIELKRDGAS
jgi:hypothetical protein